MVKKSNQNATSRIKPMTTRKEDMDYVGDEDNDGYEDDLDDTDTPFEDELDGENAEEDFDLGGEEDNDQDGDDTDDDEKLGEDDDMDLDDMGLDDEDYDTGDDDEDEEDDEDLYADDDEEDDDDDGYSDDDAGDEDDDEFSEDDDNDEDDMDDDDEDEDAQLESLSRKVSLRDLREEVEDLGDKSSKLLKKLDDKAVSPALAKEMLSTLVGYLGGAMDLYTDLEKYAAKSDYENKDLAAYPYKA